LKIRQKAGGRRNKDFHPNVRELSSPGVSCLENKVEGTGQKAKGNPSSTEYSVAGSDWGESP